MLPRQAAPERPRRRLLVAFAAAGQRWALPAAEVAAVAELGPVTPLPTADPSLLGVTLHRGRAVALRAPDPAVRPAAPGYLVLLRSGGERVAAAAEELIGLETVVGDGLPDGFRRLDPGLLLSPLALGPAAAPAEELFEGEAAR